MSAKVDPLVLLEVAAKRLRMEGTEGVAAGPLTADKLDEFRTTFAALVAAARELVTALDETNWSSWQTTAGFDGKHESLRAALANFPESQS
jgi:hypothetical protein